MIKSSILIGGSVAVVTFALGCYVGWKTTIKVIDSILLRASQQSSTKK